MLRIGFGPSLTAHCAPPRAAFDFTAGMLPPGARLARASTGSRFDAAGMLRIEPADAARFDHDPATGALRGLLIEAERTNESLESETIGNARWNKVQGPALSDDVEAAPDGAMTADMLGDADIDGYSCIAQSFTEAAARTVSAFVKKDDTARTSRFVVLRGGPPLSDLALDTATGETSLIGSKVVSGHADDCGGFWRLVLVNDPMADRIEFYPAAGASASWAYSASATGSAVVWGLQAERGPTATSYIPTGAAPATRAADVLMLDWGRFGIADGPIAVRYIFDDGSIDEDEAEVTGGCAVVPTTLARPWIRRIERR